MFIVNYLTIYLPYTSIYLPTYTSTYPPINQPTHYTLTNQSTYLPTYLPRKKAQTMSCMPVPTITQNIMGNSTGALNTSAWTSFHPLSSRSSAFSSSVGILSWELMGFDQIYIWDRWVIHEMVRVLKNSDMKYYHRQHLTLSINLSLIIIIIIIIIIDTHHCHHHHHHHHHYRH